MRPRQLVLPALSLLVLGACATAGPESRAPTTQAPPPRTSSAAVASQAASPSPTDAATSCASMAAALPVAHQVGQLFMVAVDTGGLTEAAAAAVTDAHVGSVVLLGQSRDGASSVAQLAAKVEALGQQVPILVAVDQEGGTVQRLKGPGFSDIPSAVTQAGLPSAELRSSAQQWGRELRAAGVQYNLAPVADVVPADLQQSNAPIGALERNFGNTVGVTSRSVADVVAGMRAAGVATSLKHFPGLGKVAHNTDFAVAHDALVGPHDPDWAAFRKGIEAGASSVMISSAVYDKLDPGTQAVFSKHIIGTVLRGELGFEGVVISDDLGAAGSVADVPVTQRAVRFFEAGGDLLINADSSAMDQMAAAVVAQAGRNPAFRQHVTAAASRVLALKASVGLVSCS